METHLTPGQRKGARARRSELIEILRNDNYAQQNRADGNDEIHTLSLDNLRFPDRVGHEARL